MSPEPAIELWCEYAWLGGEQAAASVTIGIEAGRIASVEPGTDPPGEAERLPGLTVPGFANVHSHAFQRILRGRTHSGHGDFWTWRRQMYAALDGLDPDRYLALATATFAEMAEAGITVVGEFHYLHHAPGGGRYDDPNAMGRAILEAARRAGIRITLLDTCYLHGGIDTTPDEAQIRFSDGDADAWAERVELIDGEVAASHGQENGGIPMARVGAAIHSVRAVDPGSAARVAEWASAREAPLHAHVSEQPAENEACQAAYGATPSALLEAAGATGPRFTAVHATHLDEGDFARLGGGGVCLCPTTERDLADGIGPARRLLDGGASISIGTDSNAVIDPIEETRAVELDQRLATGQRGVLGCGPLMDIASAAGYRQLGWAEGGRIAPGAPADLVTVGLDSVRMAGTAPADPVGSLLFAANAGDVQRVMVAGRTIVAEGRHRQIDVPAELAASVEAVEGKS